MRSGACTTLLGASLVLLVLALRAPLLPIPLERDEGEYAYIAWRLGYNELPYRDWFDQKPPAVFYVYRLALMLPFEPVRAIHLVALLFSATSASALFALGLRFMSRFWAWLAGALFALLAADPLVQGTAANTELFMLCPLILSQIAFVAAVNRQKKTVLFMLLAGALTGVAVMFKQVAIVNWLLITALYPMFVRGENRWRATISFAAWSAMGLLTVLGFVVLYFFAHGGLRDFVDNVLTHNLRYIGAVPASARFEYCWGTLQTLARSQAIVWLFAAAGLIGLFKSGKPTWSALLIGWLITSVIGASASGYFFPHYFQQLLPPLALAAAAGADRLQAVRLLKFLPRGAGRAVFAAVLGILPAVTLWPFLFTYTAGEAVRRIYPGNFFAEMPHFAQRIEEVTPQNKPIFIFGSEPELLFYAHRRSATRYIFLFPLYGPYGNARQKQLAAAEEVKRANPPTVVYSPNLLFFTPGTDQYFTDWSRSYMEEHFYVDTLLVAGELGIAQMLNVANDVQADVSRTRDAVVGAILVKQSREGQ